MADPTYPSDHRNGGPDLRVGYTVNIGEETSDDDGASLLTSGDLPPLPGRPMKGGRATPVQPAAELLPPDCQGIACLARSMLVALMEECGQDRACWRLALARIKGQEQLPGNVPPA